MNINSILDNVGKVIVGKDDVVVKVLTSILAGGHILLEDVSGTGKTMLAKTIAKSIDCEFKKNTVYTRPASVRYNRTSYI